MRDETLYVLLQILPKELLNTLYMVGVSGFVALLLGLFLGVVLVLTAPGGLTPKPLLYRSLGLVINIGRSFPFAILLVALIPFTRWIVGTSLGTTASIVPLAVAAAPFVARLVEIALREVDGKLLEAARVMGSSTWQMTTKVLLPEALPSLIQGATLTAITLIGYSAMAGLVGGGGLGKVAFQYGYNRFNGVVMFLTIALIVVLVQLIQWIGNRITDRIRLRRGL